MPEPPSDENASTEEPSVATTELSLQDLEAFDLPTSELPIVETADASPGRRPPPRPARTTQLGLAAPGLDEDLTADDTLADVLAPSVDDDHRLLALLEGQLQADPDAPRATRLHVAIARLFELGVGDLRRAAEHYQAALQRAPDNKAAIRGARRVYTALKRHPALPALFDAEVQLTGDPAARARLLYAKGRVLEEHLKQAPVALAAYEEALELDPGNLTLLKAVERTQRRDQRWDALAETYGALARAVEDPGLRAAWLAMRARLTRLYLDDPDRAVADYRAALNADPDASEALSALKHLLVDERRWSELLEVIRREHDRTADGATRAELVLTIARLEERGHGDFHGALETLEEGARAFPHEPAFRREIRRLAELLARPRQAAEALVQMAEDAPAGPVRAELCYRLGALHEHRLRRPDQARAWYEAALDALPSHRGATAALVALFERQKNDEALVDALRRRAAALSDPRERAALHHRAGFLLEHRLERPDEAALAYGLAVSFRPDHLEAFDDLCRLHTAAGRWRELAELLERAADRDLEPALAVAWLFRLGAVQEDRLDDLPAALATYERILERDPESLAALQAVRRVAIRLQRYPRAISALRREADLTHDLTRRHGLLHQAAELVHDRLADPSEAVRALTAILGEDPEHLPSLESLARIHQGRGAWDDLADAWGRTLPLLPSVGERVRLLQRIGDLAETHRADRDDAVEAYKRALDLAPDDGPCRDALERLLRRWGPDEALAESLEARLQRATEASARARLGTALGQLYEESLRDTGRALRADDIALASRPTHRPALDARARILRREARWKDLVEALREEAEALSDDPLHANLAALEQAQVLSDHQGAVAIALDALRPVFARRPDHPGALLTVEAVYARARDRDGLAATYEKLASVTTDPAAQRAALHELARVQRMAGRDDDAPTYRRLLALAPEDPLALEALSDRAERDGDHATLLAMQARLAALANDPGLAAFHQARVGELVLAEGDAAGAIAAFRAALALDPQSVAATRGLTRAARSARSPSAMRAAARFEHEVIGDTATAVALSLEAASLHVERDEPDEAAEDYSRALEIDPDTEEASRGLVDLLPPLGRLGDLLDRLHRAALSTADPERAAALHLQLSALHAEARGDLPAALAAVDRALGARPDGLDARARRAELLERHEQWTEAAEELDRLLPQLQGDALIDAQLRLARLAEHRLDDPDRALRSLRVVIRRDERHPEALASLVRLERRRGRDLEALRLAERLLAVVEHDAERRAATLLELGALRLAQGDVAEAAEAALAVIRQRGPEDRAASLYRGLAEREIPAAPRDAYGAALEAFLERTNAAAAARSATYRELARVRDEVDQRPDLALGILRGATAILPADVTLGLALADQLRRLGNGERALDEARRLLGHTVREPRVWRTLADLLRAQGIADGSATVCDALVALGEATPDERKLAKRRERRPAAAPPEILATGGLQQLAPDRPLAATAAPLTAALHEVFAKLHGLDHERHGLSRRERLRPGDAHRTRAFADRVAAIVAAGDFDLFITDDDGPARAAIASPPALLLPRRWERETRAALAFQLARPLTLIAQGLHPLDVLGPGELEAVLAGAARHQDPTFAWRGHGADALEGQARRVSRALPWLHRGRLADAAGTFSAQPTDDLEGWVASVQRLARRAALLVADDLAAALGLLDEPLGPDNAATDLLRFWVSDAALRFRQAVAQHV
ncbi:MAG: tetratricopeptide repeat protein [Sandaracinaceae bacterium]